MYIISSADENISSVDLLTMVFTEASEVYPVVFARCGAVLSLDDYFYLYTFCFTNHS